MIALETVLDAFMASGDWMSRRILTPDDVGIKVKRRRIAEQQNWQCHWCGLPMNEIWNDPMQVSLDELNPRHNGGAPRHGNFVAAHRKCNSERHPELNRRKWSEPKLVATTGETETESPFAILKGKMIWRD
jgi:hypothetical protein